MKLAMDEVSFERQGTEVRMRKASWPKHEMSAWRAHDRIARRLVSRPSPGVRVFELRQRDRAQIKVAVIGCLERRIPAVHLTHSADCSGIGRLAPGSKRSITNCAFKHHIVRRRSYVSEKRPICGCRAHHGCSGLLPRRGNLVGDPGRECERRPHLRSKVALQALESGLGCDKTRQERSERACASSATDHAARDIPCQCSAAGICDSFVSDRQEVSGQLSAQGVPVGATLSGSEQLREIARENNAGSSSWSDSGKDALTFFDLNCAD